MRVEIVACDICDVRIEEDGTIVQVARGDRRMTRDICALCWPAVDLALRGGKAEEKPKGGKRSTAGEAERAKRIANSGIEAYADGASADQLVGVLRDVVSAARREEVVAI